MQEEKLLTLQIYIKELLCKPNRYQKSGWIFFEPIPMGLKDLFKSGY